MTHTFLRSPLMQRVLALFSLTLAVTVLGVQLRTANADLPQLDSSAFSFKYEMDVNPTTQDLPGTAAGVDFFIAPEGGGPGTFASGILTMPASTIYYNSNSTQPGNVWNSLSYAAGYTIEARLQTQQIGTIGSIGFWGSTSNGVGGYPTGEVTISDTVLYWGFAPNKVALASGLDNSVGFHDYRIAQLPGQASYNVWRDGILMNAAPLDSIFNYSLAEFNMGAINGQIYGTTQVDYLRFTSGAYAPAVPEPSSAVLVGLGILFLGLAKRWKRHR